jgi:hypothetical protein
MKDQKEPYEGGKRYGFGLDGPALHDQGHAAQGHNSPDSNSEEASYDQCLGSQKLPKGSVNRDNPSHLRDWH